MFYEMDGRKSPYIKEMFDWYREEDAGGLRRSELNESVENMMALNAVEGDMWKSENSWRSEKSNQNIVTDEEIVRNIVMNEKIVKNSVMNANIDPKVVMNLSSFKIAGWNTSQHRNKNYWKNILVSEPWLLIGIPNRAIHGATLCEVRLTHEEIDVTSSRSSCDDAMLHATAFC